MGYPFFSFFNCSYKFKRILGFVPILFLFFFDTINARSIGTYQLIGVNMKFFSQDFRENLADLLTAIGLGLVLCNGLLSYFDVLVK